MNAEAGAPGVPGSPDPQRCGGLERSVGGAAPAPTKAARQEASQGGSRAEGFADADRGQGAKGGAGEEARGQASSPPRFMPKN
jgi:hypothetical protein